MKIVAIGGSKLLGRHVVRRLRAGESGVQIIPGAGLAESMADGCRSLRFRSFVYQFLRIDVLHATSWRPP